MSWSCYFSRFFETVKEFLSSRRVENWFRRGLEEVFRVGGDVLEVFGFRVVGFGFRVVGFGGGDDAERVAGSGFVVDFEG